MRKIKKGEFWNSANTITVIRIAFVPMVMVLLMYDSRINAALACFLFVVAAVSDLIDGYLARKYHLESTIGAFLDPLADKLLVIGAMIMLIPLARIPAWMVAVFIIRDMTITALRGIAASEGMIIAASSLGKYKTTFENVALAFLIFHYPLFDLLRTHEIGIMMLWIGLFLAVISGAQYLYQFVVASVE
jgi:CDP-diacylglycerol--glycerol-3-phosphate 3-phosphatidyltransferase